MQDRCGGVEPLSQNARFCPMSNVNRAVFQPLLEKSVAPVALGSSPFLQ